MGYLTLLEPGARDLQLGLCRGPLLPRRTSRPRLALFVGGNRFAPLFESALDDLDQDPVGVDVGHRLVHGLVRAVCAVPKTKSGTKQKR